MPSSRLSTGSVDYWVDGSRRDVSLEEFYTMGPELGRQVCYRIQLSDPSSYNPVHITVAMVYIGASKPVTKKQTKKKNQTNETFLDISSR